MDSLDSFENFESFEFERAEGDFMFLSRFGGGFRGVFVLLNWEKWVFLKKGGEYGWI